MKLNPSRLSSRARLAVSCVFLAAAGWAGSSFAHPPQGPEAWGFGPGPRMAMKAPAPEQLARRVDRLLDGLEVTEAQRAGIRQTVLVAARDLQALDVDAKPLHEKAAQLLLAPEIDAAAIEAMRAESMSRQDARSRRVSQAMIEVSRQLTPAQRAKLAERLQRRFSHPAAGAHAPEARRAGPNPR